MGLIFFSHGALSSQPSCYSRCEKTQINLKKVNLRSAPSSDLNQNVWKIGLVVFVLACFQTNTDINLSWYSSAVIMKNDLDIN